MYPVKARCHYSDAYSPLSHSLLSTRSVHDDLHINKAVRKPRRRRIIAKRFHEAFRSPADNCDVTEAFLASECISWFGKNIIPYLINEVTLQIVKLAWLLIGEKWAQSVSLLPWGRFESPQKYGIDPTLQKINCERWSLISELTVRLSAHLWLWPPRPCLLQSFFSLCSGLSRFRRFPWMPLPVVAPETPCH